MLNKSYVIIVAMVALFVLDRWLKSLALSGVTAVLPFGQFILFKNFGIIFSWPLPSIIASILMAGALVVVIIVFLQSYRRKESVMQIAATLMFIGAVSNFYDRLAYGFIIDWAYLGMWWPVFNLADVLIGAGLIVYLTQSHSSAHKAGRG